MVFYLSHAHGSLLTKLIFISLVLLTIPVYAAKALVDRQWIEVKTENFRVRSVLTEEQTVKLVRDLELMRAAVPLITNAQQTETVIPTDIFVVNGIGDFRKIGISTDAVGVFRPGIRRNLIVIRQHGRFDETSVMQHEYTHFLMRNQGTQVYPRWYDEGFSEYFSSAVLNGDQYEVGRFPSHSRSQFKRCGWVFISRIINPQITSKEAGRNYGCMFYPESWALVHYIQTLENHADKTSDYLKRVESGENSIPAFEAAFGASMDDINLALKRYVRAGKFNYISLAADELLPNFAPTTQILSRTEAALNLGNIALTSGELKQAHKWYNIAKEDPLFVARATAGIADAYKFDDDFISAQPLFEQAYELAPNDLQVILDVGEFWHSRAREEKDTATRDSYLKTARKYYGKAWKLNDMLPEVYAMYGDAFVLQGAYERALDSLETANYLLPSSISIKIDLAAAYAGVGRYDEAEQQLNSVIAWSHARDDPSETIVKIQEMIRKGRGED